MFWCYYAVALLIFLYFGFSFQGVPSPVKKPGEVNVVIFRENTEDIYAGIEFKNGTPEAKELADWLGKKGVSERRKLFLKNKRFD